MINSFFEEQVEAKVDRTVDYRNSWAVLVVGDSGELDGTLENELFEIRLFFEIPNLASFHVFGHIQIYVELFEIFFVASAAVEPGLVSADAGIPPRTHEHLKVPVMYVTQALEQIVEGDAHRGAEALIQRLLRKSLIKSIVGRISLFVVGSVLFLRIACIWRIRVLGRFLRWVFTIVSRHLGLALILIGCWRRLVLQLVQGADRIDQ